MWVSTERTGVGSGPSRPSSQCERDLFATEGQRVGNMRQRQEEIEDKREGGKGTRERGR